MHKLTGVNLGWVAGIIEGEGYLALERNKDRKALTTRMVVQSTDLDTVERLVELTGLGKICLPKGTGSPKHRQIYRWQVWRRDDVVDLLTAILPLLGERRTEQALKVLHPD